MDQLEAVTERFEAGWGGGISEEVSSDCKGVVCRRESGGPAGREITYLGVCRVPEVALRTC